MNKMRWVLLLLATALAGAGVLGQERGVQLRVVRYDGLKETVLRNRGKVILVDFWGEFCPPCKMGFPHVVQLHRQYAKHGLVVISVSVDNVRKGNSEETRQRVQHFLHVNGAEFTNLLLDETPEFCLEKLRLHSVPCYYVFNRQGKWTQFGEGGEKLDPAAMDHLIVELLKEK
jgi:thiol-disulfide isomerase/thioredoxin